MLKSSILLADIYNFLGELKINNEKVFLETREYEGEFDSLDGDAILLPSALIEILGDSNSQQTRVEDKINVTIYIAASRVQGIENSTGALTLVDFVSEQINGVYFAKSGADIVYSGFEKYINLPGIAVYKVFVKAGW